MKLAPPRLPKSFFFETPISKSPKEVFQFLAELFEKACEKDPKNGYIKSKSIPGNIRDNILTLNWYLPYVKAGTKILDLGCHHAPDSSMIRFLFGDRVELFGCDVAEPGEIPVFHEAIQLQYKKMVGRYQIPFEDEKFDMVIASGCLEHVALDLRLLEEVHRVLKSNGTMIITYLPNHWSLGEWVLRNIKKQDFHFRLYRLGEAKQLLRHHGFHPTHASRHSFFWDRRLMALGLSTNHSFLKKIMAFLFPIDLIASCLKIVAIRRQSM